MEFKYVSVSSNEQSTERQMKKMHEHGIEEPRHEHDDSKPNTFYRRAKDLNESA